MYNLLRFLKKYYYILMFVILEIICVSMLMHSLPYHKRKLVNLSNSISGYFFDNKTKFNSYFSLMEENQKIIEHNKLLMSKLYSIDNDSISYYSLNDKSYDTIYKFIPARVINNSIYHTNNYLLLDKGKKDGITVDMGVICNDGIVGKIANVSNNYSTVLSLLHPYTIVSAVFTDNQHIANVCWDNKDYRFGLVKDIPYHLEPKKGDTLVTSGFSNIYPPNIMIGTIEEMYENNSDVFSMAKIRFSTNFSTLRNVYIIKNIYQSEIDSLTNNIQNYE